MTIVSLLKSFSASILLLATAPTWSQAPITSDLYEKIIQDLQRSELTPKEIANLGPGVTGGGDSCEQKIAYSYTFFLQMIEREKIAASVFKIDKNTLLEILKNTRFAFSQHLEKGRPVEALNIPPLNTIVLNRSICHNSFEPLTYYAPLFMHEALRIVGLQDADANYEISKKYISVFHYEANEKLNNKRSFRIISGTAIGSVAMAWGLKDEPLNFEAFDALSEEEQWKFFANNSSRTENYLVDLKRLRIITTLRSGDGRDIPLTEFSDIRSGNHQRFELFYQPRQRIAFTHTSFKWHSEIESIYALDEKMQVIGQYHMSDNSLNLAIEKVLTAKQLKVWRSHATSFRFELIDTQKFSGWKIEAWAEQPKSLDPSYLFQSRMQIKFVEGNFKISFDPFKMQQQQY